MKEFMVHAPNPSAPPQEESGCVGYGRALLNILDDFANERERFQATQSAILNILEDFALEKLRLEEMKSAVLNILDDLAVENRRLEEMEQVARASLHEKETLLKEVHHRVKNNLQLISSLLNLQSRYQPDETRALLAESQDRVHSIALVHEILYQSGDLGSIEFSEYLHSLVAHLSDNWKRAAGPVQVSVRATGVRLPIHVAIPCGLIVSELLTNAFKHAFPHGSCGHVLIQVEGTAPGSIHLVVGDTGIGLRGAPSSLTSSGSLGLQLVATLARQLRAEVEVTGPPGTTFRLRFKVGEE
jgi:two-component sensor histidine kinase